MWEVSVSRLATVYRELSGGHCPPALRRSFTRHPSERDQTHLTMETLIARWVAVLWIVFGLSHLLHSAKWEAIFVPLRDKETGGLIIASYTFPIALIVVLGHNVWVWDIPVIITVAGWMATFKGLAYVLLPRAHAVVMTSAGQLRTGFRSVGIVMIVLGVFTGYDAFFRR